jgi:hypothetical protein
MGRRSHGMALTIPTVSKIELQFCQPSDLERRNTRIGATGGFLSAEATWMALGQAHITGAMQQLVKPFTCSYPPHRLARVDCYP